MSDERGPLSFGDEPDARGDEPDAPGDAPQARGDAPEARGDAAGRSGARAGSSRRRAESGSGRPSEQDVWLPGPATDEPPRAPRSRLPGIVLMVAAFLLLVVVGLNTLRTEGGSSTGPAAGDELPRFAAPLVLSGVEGDVNLARTAGQGAAGDRPACDISDPAVLTSCDLVRGKPAVLAFFADGESRCVDQLDELDAALRTRPQVRGAAVAVRGDRADLRRLVRSRDWGLDVVQDRDGALANVLGVAVCPQLTFLLPGGRVHESSVGELSAAQLGARLDRLVAAAER